MPISSYWESRKVLVAGGCGFIGSYLVEELVTAGATVTVVDNLEIGVLKNIPRTVRFHQLDLCDFENCRKATAGMDVVMNLAARTSGLGYSTQHHGEMLYHNTVLQLHMLEAARLNSVNKFLVVSSSCIYPDDAVVPTPEVAAMLGSPERGNEGYGWAKRTAELQATYYEREYGMNISVVRPFNVYGARYLWRGDKSHVIPTLVKRVLDGDDPVLIWGSGQQRRTFLHARDLARLMMLVVQRSISGPVNAGYEDSVSMAELVHLICDVAGRNPRLLFDTTKPEGAICKAADATRLRDVTDGYEPQIGLRGGIEEMIGWYERSFTGDCI